MKVENILLKSNSSLKDAIYVLENTDKGIVLISDENNILLELLLTEISEEVYFLAWIWIQS